MPGNLAGLGDLKWKLFETIFSLQKQCRQSLLHVPLGYVLNRSPYILMTGYWWCYLPLGEV